MVGPAEKPIDFLVSRADANAVFADRIGRILENAGYRVVLQQWDFVDRNFMERMHATLTTASRLIALLSNEYLNSDHCTSEWLNFIARDPLNKQGRLIVMRVTACVPTGLLSALAYWDLVHIESDATLLRDVVLAAVKPGRHKGEATPAAPYWHEPRPVVHREIKATPSFTGRESELAALDAALWSGSAAAVTQPAAVHGLGGIGKSVLAREYAHRNRERYAGVWWLNAANPAAAAGFDGIETALVELGAVFIPGLDAVQDRPAAARKTLDFIAHAGFEQPWLLVYDNVDHARALRDWAPLGNAQVLATSRISGWSAEFSTIEVEEWDPPDAVRYLLRESGRRDLTEDDAGTIAAELGYLPLALSHAAAYLRARPNATAQRYLNNLTQRMREAPKDAEYSQAVFATLQENADQAQSDAKGARAVLSLAAFCAPDAIPEELFQQNADCYPPDIAELAANSDALEDAIGALAHLSLIDFDPVRRIFSIHRLTQAAARDGVGGEAETWAESALRTIFAAFPEPEPQTWSQCERLVGHARAVAAHVTADSRELTTVLFRAGGYLQERAPLAEVVPLYDRSREVLQRLTAAEPSNTDHQRNLAVIHIKIGEVLEAEGKGNEALSAYRSSRDVFQRLAAADSSDASRQQELSVSNEKLGHILLDQGKYTEAVAAYRASHEIIERLVVDHPSNPEFRSELSKVYHYLGNVYFEQGDLAQALDIYRRSLAIREHLGEAEPGNAEWQQDLSRLRENIGDVLNAQGNLDGSLDMYRESHAIFERLAKIYPDNAGFQSNLLLSHQKIGDLVRTQNDMAQAMENYQASKAIAERLAAADPCNARWQGILATSVERIGSIYELKGQATKAIQKYEHALALYKEVSARRPADVQSRLFSVVPLWRLGKLKGKHGRKDLEAALAILKSLARENQLDAMRHGWIKRIEADMAEFSD